jgi:hypothetical protein
VVANHPNQRFEKNAGGYFRLRGDHACRRPFPGGVDAGGELDTKGIVEIAVLPGNYTLVVRPLPPSEEGMDRGTRGSSAKSIASPIPVQFHRVATSPYKVEVVKGTKPVLTFDLAAPAP